MATGGLINEFCEETTCPICLEYFKEPVTIDCGHNFCQACLTQCWAKLGKGPSCPKCREVFRQKDFRPNRQLANLVELVRKLRVENGVERKQEECKKHQEPLMLFCCDDQAPICVVCGSSKEHQKHRVLPMEEAFLEYKKETQTQLKSLTQEKRKLMKQKLADVQRSEKFLAQLQVEKKKNELAFQQLHNYLEKEKHFRLSLLEEMEKEIAKKNAENAVRFSKEVSHLNHLITEMEKKCQQSENTFLQDPKTILSRYVKEPGRQLLGPPLDLEVALRIYSKKTPALEQTLAESQGLLKWKLDKALYKVNMTLDPKTAHPQLIVSPDMKSVTWDSMKKNLPANPERFDTLQSVLGCEEFTSGRHCWVVEVKNVDAGWAVGVARESVKRKGNIILNPNEGFWIVQTLKKFSCYSNSDWLMYALTSPQPVNLSARIPQKICVSLDYEEGCVDFFSVKTKERLFAFPSTSFSGEALRPFFCLTSDNSLNCCS